MDATHIDPAIRDVVLHAREARLGGITASDMLDCVREHARLRGLVLGFDDAVDLVELFEEGES